MKITLKDGSVKEYQSAMSVYDIAMDSFFMEFPMGEFVRSKLNNLKNFLK